MRAGRGCGRRPRVSATVPGMAVLSALALALLVMQVAPAAAYCVRNETDAKLVFEVDPDGRQGRNANFRGNIGPGRELCCDWSQHRCNVSTEAWELLRFSAARVVGMMRWTCVTQARADAQVTLYAHKGSRGCRWGSKTPETDATAEAGGERNLWAELYAMVSGWLGGE
jgi:hypothetical protein